MTTVDYDYMFKEATNFLKDGPVKGKEEFFLDVFDIILGFTQDEGAKQYFSEEFMSLVLKFTGPNFFHNNIVYRILINIFAEEDLNEKFCASTFMIDVVNLSLSDIFTKNSKNADPACNLLSNITRFQSSCKRISDRLSPLSETVQKLVSVFTTTNYNTLDHIAMVLCNLSQLTEVRDILTQPSNCMLQKLVPYMNHATKVRRQGIIGVVHNCAFDSNLHSWMLSNEVDILPRLLLPLAGPEEFDDEDNDKLPIELQYLPSTKTREYYPEIRKQILETLNQLCATRFGRKFLRDHNTYIILRELHKWEKDSSTLLACENVVDILIRTEEEIGIDHLKNVDIPTDLKDKFNKMAVLDHVQSGDS